MCRVQHITPTSSHGEQLDEELQSLVSSFTIKPDDVLCGRSSFCFFNEGNDRFRRLIARYADDYQKSNSKKAKMGIVTHIVHIIMSRGGRFLVLGSDGSTWADGGERQGKVKTGRAFRDAVRGRTKCVAKIQNDLISSSSLSGVSECEDESDRSSLEASSSSLSSLCMLVDKLEVDLGGMINQKPDTVGAKGADDLATDFKKFEKEFGSDSWGLT